MHLEIVAAGAEDRLIDHSDLLTDSEQLKPHRLIFHEQTGDRLLQIFDARTCFRWQRSVAGRRGGLGFLLSIRFQALLNLPDKMHEHDQT